MPAGTDDELSPLRRRLLLLSLLPRMGTGLLIGASAMLLAQAVVPAVIALAAAGVVDRLAADVGAWAALVPLVLVMLFSQVIEQGMDPIQYALIRRIDGAHRREVAAVACGPTGIAHLESAEYQEDLRRAAGEPDNWTEGTPGAAVWAQMCVASGYIGVVLAAAVIARDALWLALALVALLFLYRTTQRRELLRPVRAWVAGLPDRRRAEYWTSVLTEPGPAKEIRIFGLAGWAARHHRESAEAHLRPFRAAKMAKLRRQWIWFLAIVAAGVGSLFALGSMAADGQMSIAHLAANLAAVAALLGQAAVNPEMLHLEAGQPPLLALRRLRRWPAPMPVTGTAAAPAGIPLVRFEQVRFAYPGTTRPVLQDLDLEIRPGEVLAVVGLNGAGKTTLTKLLAGLYAPDAGRITVDGVDLRELDISSWRRRLSVIFQDFLRYQLTLTDNIALGRQGDADPETVRAAGADAGIEDLVAGLPSGWDTPLSPARSGGVDLSGGQWQRVALARALYAVRKEARILVLDEPTAHLDVRTEFEVFRKVISAASDVSVVLISHRLSTVREADRIVVIGDGVIRESGSHDELMALDGEYATMFKVQAKRFETTDGSALEGNAR
ncbi:ABC transporter ATP-binding protein [Plantactinospora sp. CA-290183]|uniref:ABC transporter ATP-binding protein n=1 Tax=Plantactinospora sp. CA-290183 TaxID=3240006 RepID=UPI003D8E8EDB